MSFAQFINGLSKSVKAPLPGEKAHREVEALSGAYLSVKPNEHTRNSAVLILLYPFQNEIRFPLILRSAYDGFHSGEVGFPGGKYEPADANLVNTALREAKEEIGIDINDVKIVGHLTEIFIGPSNFWVFPVVGYMPYLPEFRPDAREVNAIFENSLDYFSHPDNLGCSEILIPGDKVFTPYYQLHGHKIWGATAKIIRELLQVICTMPPTD